MAEFYNDGITIVNSKQLVHGSRTIPIELIATQVKFKMPYEFGGLLINAAGVILGLWLISLFSIIWSILGLIILVVCGFNVKNIMTVESHILAIDLHNGDSFRLEGQSGPSIDAISAALREARVS